MERKHSHQYTGTWAAQPCRVALPYDIQTMTSSPASYTSAENFFILHDERKILMIRKFQYRYFKD